MLPSFEEFDLITKPTRKTDWDGYGGEPLRAQVLAWGQLIFMAIDARWGPLNRPQISCSSNGSVCFNWTKHVPTKELAISVLDSDSLKCECLLSNGNSQTELEISKVDELFNLVDVYMKL